MKKLLNLRLIASLVGFGALGACYNPPGTAAGIYVGSEPPVARVEVVPTSPGFNYVWVGGHWGWRSNNYYWIPGGWVVPSRGFSVWVPGRWNHDGHGWFWTDGYWR